MSPQLFGELELRISEMRPPALRCPAYCAKLIATNMSTLQVTGREDPAHNRASRSLDFTRFKAITFDCYGTLIDWESGLLAALRPVLRAHGSVLGDAEILVLYSELEPKAQIPYRRYRDVLAQVTCHIAGRLGFSISQPEAESLPNSLSNWLPFPDTNEALAKLKTRYQLAIISNTDDELFAATSKHFDVKFDEVITAEQAHAYKPSLAPFHLALQRLGLPRDQVLHVGQSVYHDVLPAQSLGLATVLVQRRGFGAARPADGMPDLTVSDMKTLSEMACSGH